MNASAWFNRYRAWGLKAGLAVLDQGLFSGANFIVNVLLARWMSTSSYGSFSVVFSIYLLFTGFHNALVLEPMSVFGPAKTPQEIKAYIYKQFVIHVFLTIAMGLLLATIGLGISIFVNNEWGSILISAGISMPLMLTLWFFRRLFYVSRNLWGAFAASGIYLLVLVGGLFVLKEVNGLTAPAVYYLMGVGSLFGAGSAFLIVFPAFYPLSLDQMMFDRADLSGQLLFGRWLVLATLFYTAGYQSQIFFTASLLNLETAGAWRALQNFLLPIMQMITALSTLSLPYLSESFGKGQFRNFLRRGFLATISLFFLALAYLVVLLVFSRQIENLFYAGKYKDFAVLIPLIAIVALFSAIESGFSLMNRAFQIPKFYIISMGIPALISILITPLFIAIWGLWGAVGSVLVINLTGVVTSVFYFLKNCTWATKIDIFCCNER